MGRRIELWLRLRRELLGPGTPDEDLASDQSPRDLYVTGIIVPPPADRAHELGDTVETTDRVVEPVDDEDVDDPDPVIAGGVGTPLDPKTPPSSFGISFRTTGGGTADIAVTWGDYSRDAIGWHRSARAWVLQGVDLARAGTHDRDGIRLHIVPNPRAAGRTSLFIENRRPPGDEAPIYQPQIRVRLTEGSLEPVDDRIGRAAGTDADGFLYSSVRPFARGHLTGAVWRAIDYEAEADADTRSRFWPDVVTDPRLEPFFAPDIRSEFLPAVDVPTPRFDWSGTADPTLGASALSSLDGPALRPALRPLVDGYVSWITARAAQVDGTIGDPRDCETARANLERCTRIADRIAEGIELLVADERSRLAFAFAMQAIERQSAWQERPNFVWRPFQLAFILMCLPSIARSDHPDRMTCDLLWFATGGGKTEAYLALCAFAIGLARLSATTVGGMRAGYGTVVLTRYTLRLLTLQQFRRAARLGTACESLRVQASGGGAFHGWRPAWYRGREDWLWGTFRISVGLWVGGAVTPNRHEDITFPRRIPGALSLLREGRGGSDTGEPAQLVRCPACDAWLSIPLKGLPAGGVLHLLYRRASRLADATVADGGFAQVIGHAPAGPAGWFRISVSFPRQRADREVMGWWSRVGTGARLASASAARPGYFLLEAPVNNVPRPFDFDVYCPAPACPLARYSGREQVPVALGAPRAIADGPFEWQSVPDVFRDGRDSRLATRLAIPVLTVDAQIYHRLPTLVVATVDKFATLAFEPRAANIFGNVDRYNARVGFFRATAGADPGVRLSRSVQPVAPPDLVLQDELHLIEGPLGSLAGLYETAVSGLLGDRQKYIASTATISAAPDQIGALFNRETAVFPQPALSIGETFWSEQPTPDPFDETRPGRLYVGLCAPGRGPQTPLIRLMSTLLQEAVIAHDAGASDLEVDPFATVVGYFNAVRELAGAVSLARQDVRQWMQDRYPNPRAREDPMNLSSQAETTRLPVLLEELAERYPNAVALAVATSMFGTGVDVPRLGLMFVNGQPKTTASYVQATGRVGRESGGLVVTFLRSTRPRDLDHYEYFAAYHLALSRRVEPVSVAPFSPRARERLLGPIMVAMLRQARTLGAAVPATWVRDPNTIATRAASPETDEVIRRIIDRAANQPQSRRPNVAEVGVEARAALDRWLAVAQRSADAGLAFDYVEWSMTTSPSRAVVLGDLAHEINRLPYAFRRVSQSMREVENQTRFELP